MLFRLNVSRERGGSHNVRTSEVSHRIAIAHAARKVPVRRADSDLALLEETSSKTDAGTAAGGEGLGSRVDEDLPVASFFGGLLFGQRGGGDVEVHAVGDLGCGSVLGGLAEDARGGGDI
jgi:hypothetical protein